MAKIYHCAKCGTQLESHTKAIRGGTIFNLIAPHKCEEPKALEEFETVPAPTRTPKDLDKLFDAFPFVDNINKANPKRISDKRPKEDLRKELKSTAPANLVKMAKNILSSPAPGRELEEPDGDAD